MAKKQFKTESKQLLNLMINSIYTHKEIFLRELISNASDAIDKIYYKALSDDTISFNSADYYIKIKPDKENRTLKVIDTGIGMSKKSWKRILESSQKAAHLILKSRMSSKMGTISSASSASAFIPRLWSRLRSRSSARHSDNKKRSNGNQKAPQAIRSRRARRIVSALRSYLRSKKIPRTSNTMNS